MARYVNGSAAVELEEEELFETESTEQGRRLRVVPGSRTGAQEETGTQLAPLVVTAIKCAVAFGIVLAVASIGHVALTAVAYQYERSNSEMLTALDEAWSTGSDLEVQQAVASRPERIKSLATEVYGMVPAETVTIIDVTDSSASDGGAETA